MEEALQMMSRFLSFAVSMWEIQNLTLIDDLTELHNQRYLPRALDREISRAQRLGKKFTVLFMDVDYFKKVNDSRGHAVGSDLLVEISKIFKSNLRSCDYAFRYGGDEFVALLVDSDAVGSEVVAERLRQKIEGTSFLIEGQSMKLTVSIGLACFPDHAGSRQAIIALADEAMYKGKNKSRNIVYVAS
jgi:diguanylate cyclase (GGDEF)-like protein